MLIHVMDEIHSDVLMVIITDPLLAQVQQDVRFPPPTRSSP